MTLIVGVIVGGLVLIAVGLLGAGMLFSWRSFRSYKKAELGQSKYIESNREIGPVILAVLKLSRRIFAPRLAVVRVNSSIWQEVVRRFADVVDVILIDVSRPGEGLLWELENLADNHERRILFVGQQQALEALAGLSPESAGNLDTNRRLANYLDGKRILAYRSAEPGDMRRFSRLLRGSLNALY